MFIAQIIKEHHLSVGHVPFPAWITKGFRFSGVMLSFLGSDALTLSVYLCFMFHSELPSGELA